MKPTILYEDNHLLVVEKPVNMPVQADRTADTDLLSLLKRDLKERYNKPGNVYLGLVHRLDRPVGGAIVFAKTSKAASRLSDRLRRQDFERSYIAITRGVPTNERDTLTNYLIKNKQENKVYLASPQQTNAKKAILDYNMIGSEKSLSLLKITLHTGRPHQIRVQLAQAGVPIYGDQKYGSHVNKPGQQLALWSYQLAFPHPTKDEIIRVISKPPVTYPWNKWPDKCQT